MPFSGMTSGFQGKAYACWSEASPHEPRCRQSHEGTQTLHLSLYNVYTERKGEHTIGLPVWGVEVRLVDQDDQDMGTGELVEIAIRYPRAQRDERRTPWQKVCIK